MAEIITAQGSATQRGTEIGRQTKWQMIQLVDLCRESPPAPFTWPETVKRSEPYYQQTQIHFPHLIAENDAAATAAGLDPQELFTTSVEELWATAPMNHNCTDVIAYPPASHTNQIWVGHNNDTDPKVAELTTVVERHLEDGLVILGVGTAGLFVSAGANSQGIVLTGNELTQTDIQEGGIPRIQLAMALLYAPNVTQAVSIALHPRRASSYNNIISSVQESVSVEASATAHRLIRPESGLIIHSNHYLTPGMQAYEGKPNYTSSLTRHRRATQLATQLHPLDRENMISILADHGEDNLPSENSICRHGESQTQFSFLANLTTGVIELAVGNPCQNRFEAIWQISSHS
ncbi:MAG: C45 family peptidase [bacterium]|nr:C45 family peptidase [bacterium]